MEKSTPSENSTSNSKQEQAVSLNIFSKDLKKIDSGFTFFSYIVDNKIFIVGNIKDYFTTTSDTKAMKTPLQTADLNRSVKDSLKINYKTTQISARVRKHNSISQPDDCKDIIQSLFIDKFLNDGAFIPIQVSCNKFSMAVLLRHTRKIERSKDDMKEFKQLIHEFKTCLKNRGLSFQSYFLNKIANDLIYKPFIFDEKFSALCYSTTISEADFKEKISDLINGDKHYLIINKFFDKLKNIGIITAGKVDILKVYQLFYEIECLYNTKILMIGDFVHNWYNELTDLDKKNWRDIYETILLFELPFITLPVKQVELGENHMLLLTIDGEILACGDGSMGATGNGIRNFHCVPAKIKFPYDSVTVVKIAAGGRHSMAIDTNGIIYSWGCGRNGRLGHGNEKDCFYPKLIDSLSSCKISQIDAGDTYSACVTFEGYLYTWGHGEFGRLGHAQNSNELIAKKVDFFGPNVIYVKCGYYCTIVYLKRPEAAKLELYILGAKTTAFKTSLDSIKNLYNNDYKKIPHFVVDNNNERYRKIEFNKVDKFKGNPILAVCGYQYIALISEETHTYEEVIQDNNINSGTENDTNPNKNNVGFLDEIEEMNVELSDIYLSGNINMTINKNNIGFYKVIPAEAALLIKNMKSCAETPQDKELLNSLVNLKELKLPGSESETIKSSNSKEMKKVMCSDNNTVILSKDGDLYVFGSFIYKLASDEVENYTIPLQPKGTKIISVGLGNNHIIMVTTGYEVFGAGRNSEGQLGQGKPSSTIDIQGAAQILKLKGKGIKKCYASENYSACLSFTNETYTFGDISFLEKSEFVHHQSTPKKNEWGDVYKLACAPTHILMIAKDNQGQIVVKAIGNGTYGKLGDDSENEDNRYEPVYVDIPIPGTFTELERKKNVILKCTRLFSACLVKDSSSRENKLYIWGLCSRGLFNNPKDLERFTKNYNFNRQFPNSNCIVIGKPVLVSPWNENIKKIAITDSMMYAINSQRSELKVIGNFYTIGRSVSLRTPGEYVKIALGNDHAVAISKSRTKIFSWGINIMNKLGFANDKETDMADFKDFLKYYRDTAVPVVNFNKIFENKNFSPIIAEEEEEGNNQETQDQTHTPDDKQKKSEVDQPPTQDQLDNIFNNTQFIIKNEFEQFENILLSNEIKFKEILKSLLGEYKFLIDNQQALQKLKKNLYNQFNFKMVDAPMNVKIKDVRTNIKFPKEYYQFKRNYKCLLTTLKIHPCYLMKLYSNKYFSESEKEMYPKELYRIIKQLFFNIYDDKYSQLLLITLAKMILERDIKNLIEEGTDKSSVLEKYVLYKISDNTVEYNLFARICKLLFKTQLKQTEKQEILAMHTIGTVYSKTSVKGTQDLDSMMLIRYHPSVKAKKRKDLSTVPGHVRNQKLEIIFSIIESVVQTMNIKSSDMEKKKNPVFSHTIVPRGKVKEQRDSESEKKKEDTLFLKLTKISKLLIHEISKTLEKTIGKSDSDKINDWISKKFPLIIFHKFLKIMDNPYTLFTIDAGLLVDRTAFRQFMELSQTNFYSLAYAIRYCFGLLAQIDKTEMGDDDTTKGIEKNFANHKNSLINCMKDIFTFKLKSEVNFNLMALKEFFVHSLTDRSHFINFSLWDLKRLQQVIVPNIDNIRILNAGFDFMDFVFFNKKDYPENYMANDAGLILCDIDKDENLTVQVQIKSRLLAHQNPPTLMKCQHCSVLTLHEFVLSNEAVFYKEFKFFDKSSIPGKFIRILKSLNYLNLKTDKICEYLREESLKKDSIIFEILYGLITLIVLEDKKNYLIPEEDLADPKSLLEITLKDNATLTNSKLKELCKVVTNKYDKMKIHKDYHEELKRTLDDIKKLITNKTQTTRAELYERIKKNFDKGFGNPDIFKNYKNSLKNSSKMIQMQKHLDNLPKSKNLFGKLSKEKKDKLLAFRDYELKRLMDDKVIAKVLLPDCDADQNPQNYKILIQKTPKSEFSITLTKKIKVKTNFWSCGGSNNLNTKKVYSTIISNDAIKTITNKSKMSFQKEEDAFAKIDEFILVEPKEFIKLLKILTNASMDG